MEQHGAIPAVEALEPFIGEWSLEAAFPDAPPVGTRGRVVFEWMPGGRFLIERWEVPHPDAPDGIAIIGFDGGRQTLLQHYFDSRGVARVYEMSFSDGLWKLSRTAPDFAPLSFSQRFEGTFKDNDTTIEGRWETSEDGSNWEIDFGLTYSKVS
jgi:hypothetical protein